MRAALRAALRGRGRVSPNPMVGAAIERSSTQRAATPGRSSEAGAFALDRRISPWLGAHLCFGGAHAEAGLLDRAGEACRDATIHVTLEPCSHHGKTPPCADRLIEAGVSKVVIATLDPNPRVRGRGVDRLRSAGIEVEVGPGAREAIALNLPYFTSHLSGRAWIELKEAVSLDGRVADANGASRWITGEAARRAVHRQRATADALLVGAGTVMADDPELTVREAPGPTPTRIVIDSKLRIDSEARIWRAWKAEIGEGTAEQSPTGNFTRDSGGWYRRSPRLILATSPEAANRTERYRAIGWEVWILPVQEGHLSLSALAERAAQEGFHHLLVEAGPGLAQGFLQAGLVDALSLYMAPKILGGSHGWTGLFRASLESAEPMESVELRTLGADICWKLRRAGIVEKLEQQLREIG